MAVRRSLLGRNKRMAITTNRPAVTADPALTRTDDSQGRVRTPIVRPGARMMYTPPPTVRIGESQTPLPPPPILHEWHQPTLSLSGLEPEQQTRLVASVATLQLLLLCTTALVAVAVALVLFSVVS